MAALKKEILFKSVCFFSLLQRQKMDRNFLQMTDIFSLVTENERSSNSGNIPAALLTGIFLRFRKRIFDRIFHQFISNEQKNICSQFRIADDITLFNFLFPFFHKIGII